MNCVIHHLRLWLLPSLLLGLMPAHAQSNEPVFEAFADARQVLLNNYFEVSYTLKNADGEKFRVPAFKDFVILSGPARSVSTTIINGQVSKEMTYSYTLQPRRVGTFVIPPASIEVNGKILRTQSLSIEVIEGQESEANERKFYIEAIPSTPEAFIGQQVRLDYKLFTTVDIQNYNITEESDYVGFYTEDIQRPDTRTRREIIDGVQYITRVIKSIALYPQQAGILTVDPAIMQLGVVTEGSRGGSFFFGNEIRRIPFQTEAVDIRVRPLPPRKPDDFSGAVGNFKFKSFISRNTITTDDALTLTLVIEGDGDLKRIQAPQIDFPEPFEVYEPKIQEEAKGEYNGNRYGRKTIEYVCLPREAGQYSIRPSFTFFDPDSVKYRRLQAEAFEITVRQGSASPTNSIIPENAESTDLHFINLNTQLRKPRKMWFGTAGFWVLLAIPVLLIAAAFLYKRKLQALANIDPAILKAQKAQKIAMAHLEKSATYLKEQNSRAFYDEISKAMMGYVSDKLKIPRAEMNKANLRQRLSQLNISGERVQQCMEIVKNCEMALFAGMDNAEAMQQTYDHTLEILADIEKQVN